MGPPCVDKSSSWLTARDAPMGPMSCSSSGRASSPAGSSGLLVAEERQNKLDHKRSQTRCLPPVATATRIRCGIVRDHFWRFCSCFCRPTNLQCHTYGDGVAAAICSYRPSAEVVDPNLSRSTTQCRPLRPPVSDRVDAWFWTRPRTEGGRRGTGTNARSSDLRRRHWPSQAREQRVTHRHVPPGSNQTA
jgi:hypothetical protein